MSPLALLCPPGDVQRRSLQPPGRGMSRSFIRGRDGAVQMVLPGLNVYHPDLRFCGLRDVLVHQKANGTLSVSLVEV